VGVRFDFFHPPLIVPAEFGLDDGANTIHQRQSATGEQQTQAHATQKQIIQVDNTLSSGGPTQLSP
jgi:hypothetical protein